MSVGLSSFRFFPFIVVSLVALFSGVGPVRAGQLDQPHDVTVRGMVTDQSGGVLPGTAIEASVGGRTVATTQAGPDGRYRIEVPAGILVQLRARRDGFADQPIELHTVSSQVARDIVLGIGAIIDTVVITPSRTAESRATRGAAISACSAVRATGWTTTSASPIEEAMAPLATFSQSVTASMRPTSTGMSASFWAPARHSVRVCDTAMRGGVRLAQSRTVSAIRERWLTPKICRGTWTSRTASDPGSTMRGPSRTSARGVSRRTG